MNGNVCKVLRAVTRLQHRAITFAVCSGLVSVAMLGTAHADTERSTEHVIDACIQEFMSTHLAGYTGKVTVHKDVSDARVTLPLVATAQRRVTVDAVNRASGARLASVTCQVDSDGEVVAMKPSFRSAKLTVAAKPEKVARAK